MSALFLTTDELIELTGFKSRKGQTRWLEQHRWRFALARNRLPRVARDYFNERVGAGPKGFAGQMNAVQLAEQPNFSALNRR